MSTVSHSFSKLNTYEQCGKKYKHLYVLKDIPNEDNEHSRWGTKVHKAFEDRLKDGTPLIPELGRYEKLMRTIEASSGELHTERKLAVDVKGNPVAFFAKTAYIRCIVDVAKVGKTSAWVGDYKTGKEKDDTTQLDLMAYVVFRHFPNLDVIRASYVWLKTDNLRTEKYTRGEAEALFMADIMKRFNRVERAHQQDDFKPTPSGLCAYCPVGQRGKCVYAKKK